MAPSRSDSVSAIYDARQARRAMQDTWSESSADTQWSSTFPLPATQAQARPDGHPFRDDSLPHYRATTPPASTSPRPATAVPAAVPRPGAVPRRVVESTWGALCETVNPPEIPFVDAAPRPALIERVDGFLMALPLSAADKAVNSGIAAARRLGRAVSKRVDRTKTPEPVRKQQLIIGLPENVDIENAALTTVPLAQAATDPAAAARRHEIWLNTLSPQPSTRSPFTSYAAARAATAADKPLPELPLPEVPRPESLRRQTVLRRRTVRNASAAPMATDGTRSSRIARPTTPRQPARNAYPAPADSAPGSIDIDALAQEATRRRQALDDRFSVDVGDDDEHPIVDQFVRAGHVSTYARRVQDGHTTVQSWYVQHEAGTSTTPVGDSSSEEDGAAAAVWRQMEADSGLRMRDWDY